MSSAPSVRALVAGEERMGPVVDFLWPGSVLLNIFDAVTLLDG